MLIKGAARGRSRLVTTSEAPANGRGAGSTLGRVCTWSQLNNSAGKLLVARSTHKT